ncbi:MAG: tripartite tricarboxylate transporter substrate binding protein [Limnohabitans sp.]|jgi:putative tricarboxylic transport membrane protein
MNLKRREFALAMTLGSMGLPVSAQNSTWKPTDRITYVLGVTPGGSVDIYARGIQDALTQLNLIQGQTMLIDYKPGGAGIISLQQLQRNAGNAHWLGTFHTSTMVAIAAGMLKADLKDYPPIAMMVEETQMVAVRADSNIKTGIELVAALRKDATALKIGVAPALGSGTHLSIAKPLKVAGVDIKNLTIAPFKASSETMGSLLGGHIDVISATAPVIMPQVAAGKVRVLASASPTRGIGSLSQVPTWREQGIAADFVTYNGLLLPPNMSAAQIAFWEDALRKVSQHPAWLALVEKNGGRPVYRDHAESMKYMLSEQKSINDLVLDLGLASK